MGAVQSNNISSDVDSLNWSETEANVNGIETSNKNDIEIIDIDLPDIENTESETESIRNVFEKLEEITNKANNVNQQANSAESSPFISTEMYNKIMNVKSNADNNTSPFINTEKYNKIMEGGFKDDSSSSESDDSDDSTSDSEILRALSEISISSDMMPKRKTDKHHKSKHHKGKKHLNSTSSHMSDIKQTYGFSETSSEMIKTSENNYYINNATTSDTPYKVESSEINTSDINLVSVDSRNGRRFI